MQHKALPGCRLLQPMLPENPDCSRARKSHTVQQHLDSFCRVCDFKTSELGGKSLGREVRDSGVKISSGAGLNKGLHTTTVQQLARLRNRAGDPRRRSPRSFLASQLIPSNLPPHSRAPRKPQPNFRLSAPSSNFSSFIHVQVTLPAFHA